MPRSSIGLIILAAGASTRMGSPKQLLPFSGKSLIRYSVQNALASKCFPIVVVLGANKDLIKLELEDLPVFVAENPDWKQGMASSIHAGLEMLLTAYPGVKGGIIMLCDQPFVTTLFLNHLVDTFEKDQRHIIASYYGNDFGVPAVFPKKLFDELSALEGNAGAKKLIQQYSAEVIPVVFPEGLVDIDTPEDYLGLQSL
ncbi:nucleotidyltransferase family protein [Rhodocytophaga rosea]|uniref:Nucleotidyltransferase family protein n=1 Tax=Rhodocytophaga rosea TaxID=2704465 RepID=A0A6C0GTV1_9BACT|nr:nucleotidyltransferase family protein [Rhodocytophaga rosea]QHT70973.1 nucleotidyltransferase family protein [Rhodocytophaga rosea]